MMTAEFTLSKRPVLRFTVILFFLHKNCWLFFLSVIIRKRYYAGPYDHFVFYYVGDPGLTGPPGLPGSNGQPGQ